MSLISFYVTTAKVDAAILSKLANSTIQITARLGINSLKQTGRDAEFMMMSCSLLNNFLTVFVRVLRSTEHSDFKWKIANV